MGFNKSKALEEAARFVSQRKLPQAIKQYQMISEQDPQDLLLHNIIGDLWVREGNIPEANKEFHKLADAYAREGFILKAIAIYKKIVKLDSHSVEPLIRLADLYAGQKLSHEANEMYTQALALCERKSLHDQARRILKKLVAQDPGNATYRARQAEFFRRSGELKEACQAFLEAAESAYHHKDIQTASDSLKRGAEIEPQNAEILLWQARLAADAKQFDEIDRIFNGFIQMERWSQAEKLARHLIARDENNPAWQLLLKQALSRQGMTEVHAPASPLTSVPGSPSLAPGATEPLPDTYASSSESITTSSRNLNSEQIPESAPPPPSFKEMSLQMPAVEMDFSQEWDAFAPTQNAPKPPLRFKPQMPDTVEELAPPLEPKPSATSGPSEAPPEPADMDLDGEKAQVEFYLDFGFVGEAETLLRKLATKYPGHPQVSKLQERFEGFVQPHDSGPAPALESTVTVEQSTPLPPVSEMPPQTDQAGAFTQPAEFTLSSRPPIGGSSNDQKLPAGPHVESMTYGKFLESPSASLRMNSAEGQSTPSSPAERGIVDEGVMEEVDPKGQVHETDESDAQDRVLAPGIPEASGAAQADVATISAPQPVERSILDDLAQDFAETFAETDEPIPSTSSVSPQRQGKASASPFDSALEELLSELESGEAILPAEDSPQTHYNLGVAFREMGLLDEAIGEFQKVVKGYSPADHSPRFLEATSLLGASFMEKQMPEIAVPWYLRALQAPGLSEEISLALTYDLGLAYEESGDLKAAQEKFAEVYSVNIDYRDVAEKVQSLRAKRA